MRYARYFTFFLFVSGMSQPPVASAQTSEALFDLTDNYPELVSYMAADDHLHVARWAVRANEQLASNTLFLYAAEGYARAGQLDSAYYYLEQAFAAGLVNPNYIADFQGLAVLLESEYAAAIRQKQTEVHRQIGDIEAFSFDFASIPGFFAYRNKAKADTSRAVAYFSEYILRGSPAVREYYVLRYNSPKEIKQVALEEAPNYYDYLEQQIDTAAIRVMEAGTREKFRVFQQLYPDAIFPTTHFVVGKMNTGGTASNSGLFIGIDLYSRSAEMPAEELNDWHKAVIGDYSDVPGIVLHELMHFQQNYRDTSTTLLANAFREGVCDFLATLSAGKPEAIKNREYYENHREALWNEFKTEMDQHADERWLYDGGKYDRPADLGYTMGHLIALNYYLRAEDKKQAIWELLNTDNFAAIWQGSGLAD